MVSALTFLLCYWEKWDEFINRIMTRNKTWVHFVNAEMEEQSNLWMYIHSKPRKSRQRLSNQKMMATVLQVHKEMFLEFMAPGTTLTSEIYCEKLNKLRRLIQNKRQAILTKGIVLLHSNEQAHIAAHTKALLELFNWEIFSYTHMPAPRSRCMLRNYCRFSKVKVWLTTQCFKTKKELMDRINNLLDTPAAPFKN